MNKQSTDVEKFGESSNRVRTLLIERGAPVMFVASALFLLLLAGLIVVSVDLPRVDGIPQNGEALTAETVNLEAAEFAGYTTPLLIVMAGLWGVFPLELLAKFCLRDRSEPFWRGRVINLFAVACPPLRLAMPCREREGRIWLPLFGWKLPGKYVHRDLEKLFSTPMLLIALLILPVLSVEYGLSDYVEQYAWLRVALHLCTGLIWFSFTFEFLVMVFATNRRMNYIKKNWIDLAIILLPLISFLRSLRIMRAVRVAKFAKVQQLTKMTRVYRMRGLVAKTLRALLVFEVVNRIFKVAPEKRLERLQSQLADKLEEVDELKQQIADIQDRMAESEPAANTPVLKPHFLSQEGQASNEQQVA